MTLPRRVSPALCRIVFVSCCVVMVLRGHPPSKAQTPATYGQAVEVAVAVATQRADLDYLRQQLARDETTIKDNAVIISSLKDDISGIKGEERGIGLILLLAQLGSLVFQTRKEKATK